MNHEGPKMFTYTSLITSKYYRSDYELNTSGLYFLSSKGVHLYPCNNGLIYCFMCIYNHHFET